MAGVDAVYEAAFQRAGIERIFQIEDMFDCAELLARQQPPKGDRLAIITNAGGPGVMTTDALIDRDGKLAKLSRRDDGEAQRVPAALLVARQPGRRAGRRPARPLRQGRGDRAEGQERRRRAGDPHAAGDDRSDGHGPGGRRRWRPSGHKPVLAAWMGGRMVSEGIQVLNEAGIPTYTTPEKAVRAFMHLVSYARNLEILHETPRDIPMAFTLDRQRLRGVFDTILTEGERDPLGERLEGVPRGLRDSRSPSRTWPARPTRRSRWPAACGYPVVMKIHSPQITHKTDVGGVALNLATDEAVREAFEQMIKTRRREAARRRRSSASPCRRWSPTRTASS